MTEKQKKPITKSDTLHSPAKSKQPSKRKKNRLFSRLNIHVPIAPSLMLILPSFSLKAEETGDAVVDSHAVIKEAIPNVPNQPSDNIGHAETNNVENPQEFAFVTEQVPSENTQPITHQAHSSHYLSDRSFAVITMVPPGQLSQTNIANNSNPSTSAPDNLPHTASTLAQTPVTYVPEVIPGTYGSLTVDRSGNYTFNLNPQSPEYISLQGKEPATDTFTMHLSNGATIVVHIPLQGVQNNPIITGDLSGALVEDRNVDSNGLLISLGKIDVVDADHDQGGMLPETLQGQYGTLSIDENGHWQYLVDNKQSTIQALTDKTSLSEAFTVHTTDGTPQTIKMTIGGQDDNALISGGDAGTTTEERVLSAFGKLDVIDSDAGEAHFSDTDIVSKLGTLHLSDNGAWTYDLDNNNPIVQALGKGASVTDTISIQSADGSPHQITITVNGTNDIPVIGHINSKAVDEGQPPITGQITSTDIDHGDTVTYSTPLSHSGFVLHPDGSYTLDPSDKSFGHLAVGEHETLVIPIIATDNNGGNSVSQNLIIQVNGTNNIPVIGLISSNTVNEGQPPITGQITSTDIDHGDTVTYSTPLSHSGFVLHPDGGYTLDPSDKSFDHLAVGEHETLVIPIIATDNNGGNSVSQNLIIRINGTNDGAVISGVSTAKVTEDLHTLASGKLIVTDVDTGEAHFSNTDVAGALGILHITDNGSWTYNLDNKNPVVQALTQGETATDTITVQSVDGTTHQIAIIVNGSTDRAVIGGTDTGDVVEDVNTYSNVSASANMIHTRGQLNIVDADTGEARFEFKTFIHSAMNPEWAPYASQLGGRLSIDKTGDWEYEIDTTKAQIQALGVGETLKDTVVIHSVDGTEHTIALTIHGTNDAPICSSEVTLHSGTEDTNQTFTLSQLLANTTDVDANDLHKLHVDSVLADHGSVTKNPDGSFTFHPDKDYNGQVHFSYDVQDAHGGVTHTGATTSLQAINDNPDTKPTIDSVIEDTETHHSIDLLGNTSDPEGDALSISQIHVSFEGQTGPLPKGVRFASDGHTLVIDSHNPCFQHLSAGQKADIVVHYMVDDNHGGQTPAVTTVTMVGTDDKAQLQSSQIDITENQALHTYYNLGSGIQGHLNLVDPDSNDQTQFSFSTDQGSQNYGGLTVWPDGSYRYALDLARNHHANDRISALKAGESLTDQYQIQTADGQTKLISVTIHGEDNNAHIDVVMPQYLPASQNVYEDNFVNASPTHLYAGGSLKVIDPDHGDAQLRPEVITTAHQGEFVIRANGSWSYTIDNAIDKVQHLGAGESFTESHTVYSKDGTASQLLTVTVHGTNDNPIVSSQVHIAPGTEDTDIQLSSIELLTNATDIDHNDHGQLTVSNLTSDHGVIIDNKDGTFRFHPDKDYNGQVHFSYDVQDTHGGVTHTGASTTLSAINDAATFGGDKSGQVSEDGHLTNNAFLNANGQLTTTDSDNPDNTFQAVSLNHQTDGSPSIGDLAIQKDGRWNYVITNGRAEVQSLGVNQQLKETFTVQSVDGTEQEIIVTISGTNDAPTLSFTASSNSKGQLIGNDVDSGDNNRLQYDAIQPNGHLGIIHVDSLSGAYQYQASNSVAGMSYNPNNQTYTGHEVFEVRVSDGHGGETREFLTFIVTASVSAPAITGGQPTITTAINTAPLLTTQMPSGVTDTPPANNVSVDLAANSDSGRSTIDDITNVNAPNITGTTDVPFSQVTIYDGSTPVGHSISDANGDYIAVLSPLSDGTHNLSAKALGPSSVLPAVSPILAISIVTDTATPSVRMATVSDSGISDHDNLTNQHAPIITGNAEANSAITIADEHGIIVASGKTDANGLYQITTNQLVEGTHRLIVTATDIAGNHKSASLSLEVDYTAPTISNINLSNVTTHQPTFSGQVDPDTVKVDIVVKDGNQIIETLHATLDGKGGYTVDSTHLPDGGYTAYIQATDKAGNQTAVGSTGTFDRFTIDSHADAPSISFESTGSDNIYNAAEVLAGAAGTITAIVNLPVDANQIDTLFINGHAHKITNTEFLSKQIFVEVVPGTALTASITDTLGNTSTIATAVAPVADLSAAPLTINLTHDTGDHSDLITNDGSLSIIGQEQGASVEYSIDNGKSWTQSFTPQQGDNTVNVRQTDLAGNVSPTTALTFTLDNQVSAPTVSLKHDTSAQITPNTDLITKDGQLSIATDAGAKLEYSIDSGHSWSTQFTPVEGQNNLLVRQTDIAGNVSPTTSFSYTVDTIPGTITVDPISTDNALNALENNQPLVITGTTSNIATGDTVYIEIGNNHFYNAAVKADGSWSLTLNASEHQHIMATDQNYPVKVGAVDVAGNVTPEITTHLLVDTRTDVAVHSTTFTPSGELYVQMYLARDSHLTHLEIISDGGGQPVIVDLTSYHQTSNSTRHPDHQYVDFNDIDISSLPEGHLTIRATGQDNVGNTSSTQSTGGFGSTLILDRTASASDDSNVAIEDATQLVSGNVLGNDTDAATVTTTGDIQGTYGLFHLNANGHYTYTLDNSLASVQQLDSGSTPLVDNVAYTAVDNHGNQTSANIAISIQGTDDNSAPTVTTQTVTLDEDTVHTFTVGEFGYSDSDHDPLAYITITQLPSHGLMLLNGAVVTANQQVTKADIDTGHLTFFPIVNENGANYAQMTFSANDGHQDSATATMVLDVNAVNDAPRVGSAFLNIQEDTPHSLSPADFNFSDVDGDALSGITITNITHGQLQLNGQTVGVGDQVNAAEISHLTYTPSPNYHSTGAKGLGGIQFTATDGHTHSNTGHIFFDIASVNDLPTVSEKQLGSSPLGVHSVDEDSNIATTGQLVITDVDGDAVTVSVDPSHAASFGSVKYDTHSGLWIYSVDNKNTQVNRLNNGDTLTDRFSLLVDDGHGGQVSKEIVMTINGHTDAPPLPALVAPPHISGSVGQQDIHASLGIPPSTQQGTPTLLTGWGISDGHGHSLTSLHGQYGTLHINPATGQLDYDYQTNSGVQKSGTGHNGDETDTFLLTLGGNQNSQVAVQLHLHSQSVHGNSGHHIDQTTLTGMDITPLASTTSVQHDEPDDMDIAVSDVTLSIDMPESDSSITGQPSLGASAYLDALGITSPSPPVESADHHPPTDMDLVLAQVDFSEHSGAGDASDVDLSDAIEHHVPDSDHSHHHNDGDTLMDIDPNN